VSLGTLALWSGQRTKQDRRGPGRAGAGLQGELVRGLTFEERVGRCRLPATDPPHKTSVASITPRHGSVKPAGDSNRCNTIKCLGGPQRQEASAWFESLSTSVRAQRHTSIRVEFQMEARDESHDEKLRSALSNLQHQVPTTTEAMPLCVGPPVPGCTNARTPDGSSGNGERSFTAVGMGPYTASSLSRARATAS